MSVKKDKILLIILVLLVTAIAVLMVLTLTAQRQAKDKLNGEKDATGGLEVIPATSDEAGLHDSVSPNLFTPGADGSDLQQPDGQLQPAGNADSYLQFQQGLSQ